MGKKKRQLDVSRRQFLTGAGGFTLALPFLPSLLPKAVAAPPPSPRLFIMASPHGGIEEPNWLPSSAPTMTTTNIYPGFNIRSGPLSWNGVVGGLSPVMRVQNQGNSPTPPVLTQALINKMNILQGIDVMFYLGHQKGAFLGNLAQNYNSSGGIIPLIQHRTLDLVLADSPKFYPDIARIRSKTMCIGSEEMSFDGPNFTPMVRDTHTLFDQVFGGSIGGSEKLASNEYVVDRVLASWNSLRSGSSKLSSEDRLKLDGFVDNLYELERQVRIGVGLGCSAIRPVERGTRSGYSSNDLSVAAQNLKLFMDIVAMAFICGNSRIATMYLSNRFSTWALGNWHQDIAHNHSDPDAQLVLRDSLQFAFENAFLYLMSRLDSEIDDPLTGETVLDNSLMVWQLECSHQTHENRNMPTVTAGSAGGWMNTGLQIDYRNHDHGEYRRHGAIQPQPGLPINRWWATLLQSMGLSPSDYESSPGSGFGQVVHFRSWSGVWDFLDQDGNPGNGNLGYGEYPYPDHVLADVDKVLPLLKKS